MHECPLPPHLPLSPRPTNCGSRALGRSPKTVALYEYSVRRIIAWRGDPDLLTLSRFEALSYVRMLNASFKPNGVHSRVKSIRACFSWCVAEEFPTVNPVRTDAYLAARGAA